MSEPGGDGKHTDGDDAEAATNALINCVKRISWAVATQPNMEQLPPGHSLTLELESCVAAFARASRRLKSTPESTIVLVKQLIHQHLIVNAVARRSIIDQTVRQLVNAYYEETPTTDER